MIDEARVSPLGTQRTLRFEMTQSDATSIMKNNCTARGASTVGGSFVARCSSVSTEPTLLDSRFSSTAIEIVIDGNQ
jgi:hypothetical protein